MKRNLVITFSMLLLASAGAVTQASAQEKTRAEVRQELIQAEANGSRLVTDTSYPEINPIFSQQTARMTVNTSGEGPAMSGSTAAGQRASTTPVHAAGAAMTACVGPAGFCTPYFGS
jgi:predicted lipid-binding transport protein (Tim44 family)